MIYYVWTDYNVPHPINHISGAGVLPPARCLPRRDWIPSNIQYGYRWYYLRCKRPWAGNSIYRAGSVQSHASPGEFYHGYHWYSRYTGSTGGKQLWNVGTGDITLTPSGQMYFIFNNKLFTPDYGSAGGPTRHIKCTYIDTVRLPAGKTGLPDLPSAPVI